MWNLGRKGKRAGTGGGKPNLMRCRFDGSVIFTIALYRSLSACVNNGSVSNVFSLGPGFERSGSILGQWSSQGFSVAMGLVNETKVYLTRERKCPAGFVEGELKCDNDGTWAMERDGPGLFRNLFFLLAAVFSVFMFFLMFFMQHPIMKAVHWKNEVFFVKNRTPGFRTGSDVCDIEETRFFNDRYEPRMWIYVPADYSHTFVVLFHEMEEGLSRKAYSVVEHEGLVRSEEKEEPVSMDVLIEKRELEYPEVSFEFQKGHVKLSQKRGLIQVPFGNETLLFSLEARLCLSLVAEVTNNMYDFESMARCCKRVAEVMDFTVYGIFANGPKGLEEFIFWAKDPSIRDGVVKLAAESSGSNTIQTYSGIRFFTIRSYSVTIVIGPPSTFIWKRSLLASFTPELLVFSSVCMGYYYNRRNIIENMGRLFVDASALFLEIDRDNDSISCVDKGRLNGLVESLGGRDVVMNTQPGNMTWATTSNVSLAVRCCEFESKVSGKAVTCCIVTQKNPVMDDDRLFISLFDTKNAPCRGNCIDIPDETCFVESVPKLHESCSLLRNGRCFVLTRTGSKDMFTVHIAPVEEDCEGLVCDEDLGIAIWIVNPITLRVVWSFGREKFSGDVDWITYAAKICHQDSLCEFDRAIDHFQRVDSMSLTMEVQLKLNSDGYHWYSVFWRRSEGSDLTICASCIDDYRNQMQKFRETDDQVRISLEYGKIRLCYFDDARTPNRIISPVTDTAQVLQLNWSTVSHCILTEWQDAATKCFKEALTSNKPFCLELPIISGLFSWQSLRGVATGRPGQLMMTAFDVTELKEATIALEESKRTFEEAVAIKSKFLLNISCAVQAPLYSIMSLYELVLGTFTDPDQKSMIEIVGTSVSRMLELLGDTLDLSMLEQNRMQVNFTKFDVREVLCWKFEHFNKVAKAKGVNMLLKIPGKFPILYCGELHFFVRIVCNVLSNAVKFTEKGSVVVSMNDLEDGSIELIVKDTGIGISPEDKERIWDTFTQGDNSITRPYGGIGVGLTLMKKMLDRIKGTVSVESKLGEGSTFRIIFPFEPILYAHVPQTIKDREHQIFACLNDPAELGGLQELTELYNVKIVQDPAEITSHLILSVVDDVEELKQKALEVYEKHKVFTVLITSHPDACHDERFHCVMKAYGIVKLLDMTRTVMWNQSLAQRMGKAETLSFDHCKLLIINENVTDHLILKKITERLQCQTLITTSCADIIDKIKDGGFNVVIFNMIMSIVDGLAFAQKLTREGKLNIPVIALSTNFTHEEIERCRKDGIQYFLRKPLTISNVAEVLTQALADSNCSL